MKKWLKGILIGIAAVLFLISGYFIGYQTACDRMEDSSAGQAIDQQTFYAEILERQNDWFLVQGLAVNDINYRGEFTFSADEKTALVWRGTAIALSDLEAGDTIAITFQGEILTIYPAQIRDVIKVQLLDDEK